MDPQELLPISRHWQNNYSLLRLILRDIAWCPFDPEVRKSAVRLDVHLDIANEASARCFIEPGDARSYLQITDGLYLRMRSLVSFVNCRRFLQTQMAPDKFAESRNHLESLRDRCRTMATDPFDSMGSLLDAVAYVEKGLAASTFENCSWRGPIWLNRTYRATISGFELLIFHELCHLYDGHWFDKSEISTVRSQAEGSPGYISIRSAFETIADQWGGAAMAQRSGEQMRRLINDNPHLTVEKAAFEQGICASIGIHTALLCLVSPRPVGDPDGFYLSYDSRIALCGTGFVTQFVHDFGEQVARQAAAGWFEGQQLFYDQLGLVMTSEGYPRLADQQSSEVVPHSSVLAQRSENLVDRSRLLWSLDPHAWMRQKGYTREVDAEEASYNTFSETNRRAAARIFCEVLGVDDLPDQMAADG